MKRKLLVLTIITVGLTIPATATVEINGSRIDLNQNPLLGASEVQTPTITGLNSTPGFFQQSACGTNQAIVNITDQGDFVCGQAGGGLETVLGINNDANQKQITGLGGLTMDGGDIDLDTNNINNIASLDTTVAEVSGFIQLTEDGSGNRATIEANGGDINRVGKLTTSTIGSQDFRMDVTTDTTHNDNEIRDVGHLYTEEISHPDSNLLQVNDNLNINNNYIDSVDQLIGSQGENYLFLGEGASEDRVNLEGEGDVILRADRDGGDGSGDGYTCSIDESDEGDWNCDGGATFGKPIETGESIYAANGIASGSSISGDTAFITDLDNNNGEIDVRTDFDLEDNDIDAVQNLDVDDITSEDGSRIDIEGYLDLNDQQIQDTDYIEGPDGGENFIFMAANPNMNIESKQGINVVTNRDGECEFSSSTDCLRFFEFEEDGDFTVYDGSKNFIQPINSTSAVKYTSTEANRAKAIYEGTKFVNGARRIKLPKHFSSVISDTEPQMKVQLTPRKLSTVAATNRNRTHITVKSTKAAKIDFRVTATRDGYENPETYVPRPEEVNQTANQTTNVTASSSIS